MSVLTTKEKAFVLVSCDEHMKDYRGVKWPRKGAIEAKTWSPYFEKDNGLHGLLWGEGNGDIVVHDFKTTWLIAEIDEYVKLEGFVKFPRATVVFSGFRGETIRELVKLGGRGPVVCKTVKVGKYETASVGDLGWAESGDYGKSFAGDHGTAVTGRKGLAQSGYYGKSMGLDWSIAVAGNKGCALTGNNGVAVAGREGKASSKEGGHSIAGPGGIASAGKNGIAEVGVGGQAMAGENGVIKVEYLDKLDRRRVFVGYVGEDKIKPNTWYRAHTGKYPKLLELT